MFIAFNNRLSDAGSEGAGEPAVRPVPALEQDGGRVRPASAHLPGSPLIGTAAGSACRCERRGTEGNQTAVKKNPRSQLLILTNLIIGVSGSGERDSPVAGWLRVSDYVTVLQVPRVN